MEPAATDPTPRTDADVFGAARRALDLRPGVPAAVRVHVDDGVATLTGTVRLPSERAEAEDALRQVAGVRRIVNEIAVTHVPSAEGFEPPDA